MPSRNYDRRRHYGDDYQNFQCVSPIIERKIDKFFNAITKIRVNPSPLKSQIEKYMESVDHFDVV